MKIEDAAIEVLKKHDTDSVYYGDLNILHEIADLAGMKRNTTGRYPPWHICKRVLDALDRSKKFAKWYFKARTLARAFTMIEHWPAKKKELDAIIEERKRKGIKL